MAAKFESVNPADEDAGNLELMPAARIVADGEEEDDAPKSNSGKTSSVSQGEGGARFTIEQDDDPKALRVRSATQQMNKKIGQLFQGVDEREDRFIGSFAVFAMTVRLMWNFSGVESLRGRVLLGLIFTAGVGCFYFFLPYWALLTLRVLFTDAPGAVNFTELSLWLTLFLAGMSLTWGMQSFVLGLVREDFGTLLNERLSYACARNVGRINRGEMVAMRTTVTSNVKILYSKTVPLLILHFGVMFASLIAIFVRSPALGGCAVSFILLYHTFNVIRSTVSNSKAQQLLELDEQEEGLWESLTVENTEERMPEVLELVDAAGKINRSAVYSESTMEALRVFMQLLAAPLLILIGGRLYWGADSHGTMLYCAFFFVLTVDQFSSFSFQAHKFFKFAPFVSQLEDFLKIAEELGHHHTANPLEELARMRKPLVRPSEAVARRAASRSPDKARVLSRVIMGLGLCVCVAFGAMLIFVAVNISSVTCQPAAMVCSAHPSNGGGGTTIKAAQSFYIAEGCKFDLALPELVEQCATELTALGEVGPAGVGTATGEPVQTVRLSFSSWKGEGNDRAYSQAFVVDGGSSGGTDTEGMIGIKDGTNFVEGDGPRTRRRLLANGTAITAVGSVEEVGVPAGTPTSGEGTALTPSGELVAVSIHKPAESVIYAGRPYKFGASTVGGVNVKFAWRVGRPRLEVDKVLATQSFEPDSENDWTFTTKRPTWCWTYEKWCPSTTFWGIEPQDGALMWAARDILSRIRAHWWGVRESEMKYAAIDLTYYHKVSLSFWYAVQGGKSSDPNHLQYGIKYNGDADYTWVMVYDQKDGQDWTEVVVDLPDTKTSMELKVKVQRNSRAVGLDNFVVKGKTYAADDPNNLFVPLNAEGSSPSFSMSETGEFAVEVTATSGNIRRRSVQLFTVSPNVVTLTKPSDNVLYLGNSYTYIATSTSADRTLTYNWTVAERNSSVQVYQATGRSLDTESIAVGLYSLLLSVGNADKSFYVNLNSDVEISNFPVDIVGVDDKTLYISNTYTFSAVVQGAKFPQYVWSVDGVEVLGQVVTDEAEFQNETFWNHTSFAWAFDSVGNHTVSLSVTNGGFSLTTSRVVSVEMPMLQLALPANVSSQGYLTDTDYTFSAALVGGVNTVFTWKILEAQANGTIVSNGTGTDFTTQFAFAGDFLLRVTASSSGGVVLTQEAPLKVHQDPSLWSYKLFNNGPALVGEPIIMAFILDYDSWCPEDSGFKRTAKGNTAYRKCGGMEGGNYSRFCIGNGVWAEEVNNCQGVNVQCVTEADAADCPPIANGQVTASWLGDDYCDADLNNAACGFDNGDCCAATNKPQCGSTCDCKCGESAESAAVDDEVSISWDVPAEGRAGPKPRLTGNAVYHAFSRPGVHAINVVASTSWGERTSVTMYVTVLEKTPASDPVAMRKEFASELTEDEQNLFIGVVQNLSHWGVWGQQTQIHLVAAQNQQIGATVTAAHRGPSFLPWHRMFMRVIERSLFAAGWPRELGCPYWDWTVEGNMIQGDTSDADELEFQRDNSPTFRLLGWDAHTHPENVVDNGPFAFPKFVLHTGDRSELQRCFGCNGDFGQLPRDSDIAEIMKLTTYDAAPFDTRSTDFRNSLEGWNGHRAHNQVHVYIGGSMLPMTSPNDPLFFLNHNNVDRLWAAWQLHHGELLANGTVNNSNIKYVGGSVLGQGIDDLVYPSRLTIRQALAMDGFNYTRLEWNTSAWGP